MNRVDRIPVFHRLWLPTVDNEFVALDISFPHENGHNWTKPLYLVLHGLNGGSKEGYVIDFCYERTKEGSTCVVLIARGLADTPLQGWTVRKRFNIAQFYEFDACVHTHFQPLYC
jgi:predicted alpha/beta-fold hydrolase